MTAVKGKGAAFWLHDGTALTKVADVLIITPPSPSRDTIDTTTHDSSGDYREFISALIDAGEFSITLHHVPGGVGDGKLLAAFATGALTAFAIDLNSSTVTQQRIAGSCIVTGYAGQDVVIDDKMTAVLSGKVSGALTQAAKP